MPVSSRASSTTTRVPGSQATGSTVRHDFACNAASMDVFIPVSLVPDSQLSLKDPGCKLQNNGTHHVTTFSYDKCGTSMTFYTDYLDIQNEITVHSTLQASGPVVFDSDFTIPLRCKMPRHQVVSASFQAVTRDPIVELNNGVRSSSFEVREFRSAAYNDEITTYPVRVPMNREAYFEVAVTGSATDNIGIRVNTCKATPSTDPNDATTFLLIQDGCSASSAVHLHQRPDEGRFRFSIHAFHFSGTSNHNDMVYIHCDVSSCPSNTCVNSCTSSTGRKRRRRSSTAFGVGNVVSSGPTIFLS